MKIAVVSYSFTGNNEALAASVAREISADHIRVSEPKPRTTGAIFLDLIFNRTPNVYPAPENLRRYDLICFIGPVWIGQVATPLRGYLKNLKTISRYAFVSISGGADGPNPKLNGELQKRTGTAPAVLIDMHIAGLLPPEPKPTRKITSAYKISSTEITKLTDKVVETLKNNILQEEAK